MGLPCDAEVEKNRVRVMAVKSAVGCGELHRAHIILDNEIENIKGDDEENEAKHPNQIHLRIT